MSERYTTDVPAVPDPEYSYLNPEFQRDIFERALDEPEKLSASVLALIKSHLEEKATSTPKEYDFTIEDFFIQSEAKAFIDKYAVYDFDGRLNMDLTSDKIGIPYNFDVETDFVRGEIVGMPGYPDAGRPIEIHLDKSRRLHQATYGHEIGHYYVRVILKALNEQGWSRLEEDFCDYFGRRMAIPYAHIEEYLLGEKVIDENEILDLMSRFRLDLDDLILGLMEWGVLPPRIAIDSYNPEYDNPDYSEKVRRGIFCLHCTNVGGDFNCPMVSEPTPLFDFTDRAWGGKLAACQGEDIYKAEILSTLTKHYETEGQLVLFRPS